MKVVINACFGGFGLSHAGVMEYAKRKAINLYAAADARDKDGKLDFDRSVPWDGKGKPPFCVYYSTKPIPKSGKIGNDDYFSDSNIKRDDPALIATVEALGTKANGSCASLRIVEIPDGIQWKIEEYEGSEHVAEVHREWR